MTSPRSNGERTLRSSDLTVRVSPIGGAILSADYRGTPFLVAAGGPDGTMASFSLVPFGNRVEHNGMTVGGRDYRFAPNSSDPLYLHGDGWLAEWDIEVMSEDHLQMSFEKAADECSPYAYRAQHTIRVAENELHLALSVENLGRDPFPFGLGQHPFFPRTPGTILKASTKACWSEREGHLPDRRQSIPNDLDFRDGALLPSQWVNNAFEGWDGKASIDWPELGMRLLLEADPLFNVGMIYMPTDRTDFFCFEPMSHLPNGHHLPDLGGLRLLAQGERMAGEMRFRLSPA
ncbi:aldose 1-epimerase [Neorhizobium sp. P12A]|uniref:aldose 1-epimerase n=1 Tax=Neorhizobium sp. P12A TaxID=2268027 RepID=UPI0011EE6F43|nr:aldose 1-epimerase [Neorhizobium sp. P12A]KAA0691396.1 aldose 1-epimerase [Neorhizobium sp. P12A]